jgi:hypothetical protein
MCFGQTTTGTQTVDPALWMQAQAQSNLAFTGNQTAQGFNAPLQGTVPLNANQNQAIGNIAGIANAPNANNPFYSTITNDFSTYGGASLPTIQPQSLLGNKVSPLDTTIQSYIDPNIQTELTPTLRAIQQQAQIAMTGAGGNGSQATAAGAFGDARQGVQNAMTDYQAMLAAGQATGTAYQNAYNNAVAARQADVSNAMKAQQANTGIAETQLQNLFGSGNSLLNLANYTTGQGLNLGQALLQAGGTQQQNQQQVLNAVYNQQLQNLLGPYQYEIPALNSTLQSAQAGAPTTTTTTAPNNALWNLLGTLGGSILGGFGQGYGQAFGKSAFSLA